MSNYKISVIIPVYNAQDTIRRSINSVINQTIGFSNIELILYDDGSIDNTREILKEYSEKYKNIVLILSDENSGYCGKGRNEGINISSADYIMFMDSDDEYFPNMCEKLYTEITKENADIVSCNLINIDKIASETVMNHYKECDSKNNKKIFLDDEVYNFGDIWVCTKIYRKNKIIQNNVTFPENSVTEDAYFIYMLLFYANKIVYLEDYVGYLRHVQEDSVTNTLNYVKVKEILDSCMKTYSFYKNNEININWSWLFSHRIEYYLKSIYKSNILGNRKNFYDLLNHLYTFEKNIDFNDLYIDNFYKILNNLIMKKQFKIAFIYFNILRIFYQNKSLRRFYRFMKNR